jgi:SAM-dependent methyltransferase
MAAARVGSSDRESVAKVTTEDVRAFYNREYLSRRRGQNLSPYAVHDLGKAVRRVTGVVSGFRIEIRRPFRVLDVGSGLGFYTKAWSLLGADVLGVDFAEEGVAAARSAFPECRFELAAWPEDIPASPKFDLIWLVNFSLMNTFDVEFMKQAIVSEALARLNPGGYLIIGWNTNFSGRTIGGYSHWPLRIIDDLRESCGFSAPLVVQARVPWLSWVAVRCALVCGRSIPVFMVTRVRLARSGADLL